MNTPIERRRFLAGLASAPMLLGRAAAEESKPTAPAEAQESTPTAPAEAQESTPTAPAEAPRDQWGRVRAQFALSPDWIHLAGFLLAAHPARVRDAIERYRRALDDNPPLALEQYGGDPSLAGKPAAAYLGVRPEEIALTDSTTMGLAILYHGLPLRAGDDVLTTEHDHYSTHESLRLATQRAGATLRKVALYRKPADATVPSMARAIEQAIVPATRVVAITWVHSSTGVKIPVRAIADVVAAANAGRAPHHRILLCVDGVHGLGVEDVTMADLGCDFFVAGAHKWMFGPRGTGIVWGRAELWPLLQPTIPAFGSTSYGAWLRGGAPAATTADVMTPGGFHSFEHRWALGEAFEFHREIGKANVASRIHALNRQCKDGLAAMKHVTLHTPREDAVSSGLVTFEIAGMKPGEFVRRMRAKRIVASATPYRTSYARLAPGLLNTPRDVDTALREIRHFAGS